jgi:hypothetical protein
MLSRKLIFGAAIGIISIQQTIFAEATDFMFESMQSRACPVGYETIAASADVNVIIKVTVD